MSTLYERLGGRAAVSAVVETFYVRILADRRVSHFFDGVDMQRQKNKQRAFLTMVFGGPNKYTGKDLRAGHAHLVARGLGDEHVDAVKELLAAALRHHGAAEPDVAAVLAVAEGARADVLGR
jgi:hemoglobin